MEQGNKAVSVKQERSTPKELTLRANGLRFSALELGEGPEVVFCLHGFPDHLGTWSEQLPALAEAGYRVIAPALRGYEPSSQPRGKEYQLVHLAEDLVGWMDDLGVRKAHVIGHDWGALVGYVAGALAPERLHSLTTLAVPHPRDALPGIRQNPRQLRNSWYTLFFQLRVVSELAVKWNDFQFIEKLWRDWSPGWQWPEEQMRQLKQTLRRPGVTHAAINYYRAFYSFWHPENRRTQRLLGTPVRVPTLALTGAQDGCVDTRMFDVMDPEGFPSGVRIERLQGAGHFLHQEKPAEVNRLLVDWLRQHPPAAGSAR